MTKSPVRESESWGIALTAHVIEACWLVAVAVIPVLYDPHAWAGFEPAKIAVLRTLGLIVAAALSVRVLAVFRTRHQMNQGLPRDNTLRNWLVACVLLFSAFGLANVFSIEPWSSWLGNPDTRQGVLTLLCNILLGLGVAIHLRCHEQVERLVTTALAASLPVSIYAILQRAGIDPLFHTPGEKATSFLGQPIFLAGYLLMLMPLCVWRICRCHAEGGSAATHGTRRWMATTFYIVVFGVQIVAFFTAEKRGPFIGLSAAVASACVLLAIYFARLRLAAWGMAIVMAIAVLLASLVWLAKAGVSLERIPIVGTLSQIVPMGKGTGDEYRNRMWAIAPEVLLGAKPFINPDGSPDRWQRLRPLLGYGPETLQYVIVQHWPWGGDAAGASRNEHRFHNLFWDTWEYAGLIGLAGLLFFQLRVFSVGYARLGFIAAKQSHYLLAAMSLGLGLTAGGVLSAVYGSGYFGLGFQLGFAAGLVLVPLWYARFRVPAIPAAGDDRVRVLFMIALLVALVGNWVDMAFIFPTAATSMLFWIFSGAIIGLSSRMEIAADAALGQASRPPTNLILAVLPEGLLGGSILITLLHGIINYYSFEPASLAVVLRASLTQTNFNQDSNNLLALFVLPCWLIISMAFAIGSDHWRTRDHTWRILGFYSGLSLVMGLSYALVKAAWIARLRLVQPMSPDIAISYVQGLETLGVGFIVLMIVMVLVIGIVFCRSSKSSYPPILLSARWTTAIIGLASCGAIWFASANIMRGEVCRRWGSTLDNSGEKAAGMAVYRAGLDIDPRNNADRIVFAMNLMDVAAQNEIEKESAVTFERAASLLIEGRQHSELNAINENLGHLYLCWAMRSTDQQDRILHVSQARDALRRATTFSPFAEAAWFDYAISNRELGDTGAADANEAVADHIVTDAAAAAQADFYVSRAFATKPPHLKRIYAHRALMFCGRAIKSNTQSLENSQSDAHAIRCEIYRLLVVEGTLQRNLGEHKAALSSFLKAAAAAPAINTWQAEAMLATVYADTGDRVPALAHVDLALHSAPTEMKENLNALKRRIIVGRR